MNHTKDIRPISTDDVPISSLPDRSNLSNLYVSAKNGRPTQPRHGESIALAKERIDEEVGRLIIDQSITSFLLTTPSVVTYLAAIYIYAGADTSTHTPDPLFPLFSFFVSAICVITWIISFRMLWKRFENYDMHLGMFIVIYLFYFLPLLKLTYNLFPVNWTGMVTTIILWLVANRLIIWYMVWVLNKSTPSVITKSLVIGWPIVALVIFATLI